MSGKKTGARNVTPYRRFEFSASSSVKKLRDKLDILLRDACDFKHTLELRGSIHLSEAAKIHAEIWAVKLHLLELSDQIKRDKK